MRFTTLIFASLSLVAVQAATSCNVGSLAGECMSTGSCSGSGGKSTPGFCPGAKDIQCCTYGECKASNTAGKCQPTASCGGKSTPGLCPGAANIQCCTKAATGGSSGGSTSSSGTCPPAVNQATVDLVKSFEGFVKSPAPDPIGLPTVGFGHLCKKKNCAEVPFKFPLTVSTASQLLQTDMASFRKCIKDKVKVKLNENQFGALASFTFNLGCGTLESSTMLKRLNKGENPNTVAAQEMPKFNHAGGKVLSGLTRRRNAEVALFKKASTKGAIPC
ncbi:lysozyme [Flagelloscypha sp. PMI_526]|nr:lysozyme [Flagelloscypha sp. PMI_526]